MFYKSATITGVTFGGLYYYDKRVCERLHNELKNLNIMYIDAVEYMDKASDEHNYMVSCTEKQVFQFVCKDIEWNINLTKHYLENDIPILRLILPHKFKKDLNHRLWVIGYYDDGDFYDSFLDFYLHYSADTIGSIAYRNILNKE